MPDPTFDYAVIRVVPRVEREEFLNAGIILFSRTQRFLGARIALDRSRLACFAPWLDPDEVEDHLNFFPLVCSGNPTSGPIGQLPLPGRFHWLVAPRSTIIQTSPVHSGLCRDPEQALARLLRIMVLPLGDTDNVPQ
jgi:hypothetical protein